jgi:hypothetical protein
MAGRRDYFFRQLVTEAEMDAGFEGLEQADRDLATDMGVFGVLSGLGVAENGTPNMTVNVDGPGMAYDQDGQRMHLTTPQNKDMSVDDSNTTTAVSGGGNEKWVSLFLKFDRSLSDSRVDGNSNTVYFVRAEYFELSVVQGAEAAIGLAAKPALISDGVLLADIYLINGQTTILDADISTARRQDYLAIAGTPRSLSAGRVKDAISDLLGLYNAHVAGAQDRHFAIVTVQPTIEATSTVNGTPGVTGSLFWEDNSLGNVVVNGTYLTTDTLALTAGDVVLIFLDGTLNMAEAGTRDILITITDDEDNILNSCQVARAATWASGSAEYVPFSVHATYTAATAENRDFKVMATMTDTASGVAVLNVKFTTIVLHFA